MDRDYDPKAFARGVMALRKLASHVHRCLLLFAYLACVALLLYAVSRSWTSKHRLTSMIRFGSKFDARSLDALKKVPHAVLPDSYGYDGQFYAQLALSPTLANPQLPRAIDNVSYRSRRILFSWTACLLGVGRPDYVVQAYALQNTVFWLANAVLLLYWLPPTQWFHFFRWAGILLSSGWLESISNSVLDGPALFVLLLALWLGQRGAPWWGTALLGISGLGKETNLLAGLAPGPANDLQKQRWRGLCLRALLLVLPVALWLIVVYCRFGLAGSGGAHNFGHPFMGWIGKFKEILHSARHDGWQTRHTLALGCVVAVIVQIAYFLTRWDRSSAWWRLGLPYALLALCLGVAVMEGWPGAFTRAMLPLAAAFNLALTANWKGWALLLAGNLHVLAGLSAIGIKLPLIG
jgi:hypothetical protein